MTHFKLNSLSVIGRNKMRVMQLVMIVTGGMENFTGQIKNSAPTMQHDGLYFFYFFFYLIS